MKDIKTFMIGFLSCACLFLLIGASAGSKNNQNGKYQVNSVFEKGQNGAFTVHYVFNTQDGKRVKKYKSELPFNLYNLSSRHVSYLKRMFAIIEGMEVPEKMTKE